MIDSDELSKLDQALRWFSHNQFNFFSLYVRNFGYGDGKSLKSYVREQLKNTGMDLMDDPIRLLTYPRILGYTFNPLSVYYC